MKKRRIESLRDEVESARQGKIKYEPDPPFVTVSDAKTVERGQEELCRLNGWKYKDFELKDVEEASTRSSGKVSILVSKSTYARLSQKAERAKLNVPEFLEKLAGEK